MTTSYTIGARGTRPHCWMPPGGKLHCWMPPNRPAGPPEARARLESGLS
ncbi:MAG: hypothetical protein WCX13_02200 [Candidatus Hydrogenedentales bacterium]